jgi:hypothetical protein
VALFLRRNNYLLIKQYRINLNRAVKEATENGLIKPIESVPLQAPAQSPIFNDQSFPPLPISSSRPPASKPSSKTTIWTGLNHHQQTDITNQQLFEKICAHLEERSTVVDSRI